MQDGTKFHIVCGYRPILVHFVLEQWSPDEDFKANHVLLSGSSTAAVTACNMALLQFERAEKTC